MANHCFVTSKKWFARPEMIDSLLIRLNEKHFEGKLDIQRVNKAEWYISAGMPNNGLSVWITSARKLEIRHALGTWMGWICTSVQEFIASELDCICSDEGIVERWKGRAFMSYEDYVNNLVDCVENEADKALLKSYYLQEKVW